MYDSRREEERGCDLAKGGQLDPGDKHQRESRKAMVVIVGDVSVLGPEFYLAIAWKGTFERKDGK